MNETVHSALSWLWDAFLILVSHLLHATIYTLVELFILLGPLMLAALASHLVSRRLEHRIVQVAGLNSYIYFLGWLGTPVHELGHAMMCVIFRHKVQELKLFKPDKESGQLGYVRHSYDPGSFYQQVGNFFIALGPIVLGGLVLFLASWLLLGFHSFYFNFDAAADVHGLADIPAAILAWLVHTAGALKNFFLALDVSSWRTWLFLYLVVAVGSHVNLSPADLVSAKAGFTILLIILFVANVLVTVFADVPLQVFQLPGRFLGLLSSLILACTGIMVPLWLVLEGVGKLLDRR